MVELKVNLNRYDGRSTVPFVAVAHIKTGGKDPYIEAPLGDDPEFAIYFKAPGENIDEQLLDNARSLLVEIGNIDNKVQEACAAECQRTGLHPRNFEGALSFIRVADQYALLRYWGTGVATEWDELVEKVNGAWLYRGVATPELMARLG